MYIGRLLAEQGFASLICDFRGSGISDGEWADTTFTSQLSDAEAILDFACTLEGINKGEIGVLGHSQGGLIGSYLAARDKRVRSLVLWAPVANPAFTYSYFFGGANAISEIMSSSDEYFNVPLYARGSQWRTDIFRKSFFEDLFKYDPVNEISKYDNPLMVISGLRDSLVWPQPQMGELYMSGHNGYEYHLQLDTTHSMGIWFPEVLMLRESVYWSAAWFIKTMHINN
jgi:pimeloyl-ACP methyl ester carboxylesterase